MSVLGRKCAGAQYSELAHSTGGQTRAVFQKEQYTGDRERMKNE
jgi:hypothetical protein